MPGKKNITRRPNTCGLENRRMMYKVKYKIIMNLAHEHEGDSNLPEKNKRILFETALNIGNNPSIHTKIKVLQVQD